MRLPWQQIAMEVIEVSAPELGDKLYQPPPEIEEALEKVCKHFATTPAELGEALAGWGIVKAIKWGLARCPDHQPPSANAVVKGPSADRQIARAAGYHGDPAAYVEAAASLAFPTLELVEGGTRFRGLDRYDSAWGDRNKEAWAAWKAANPPKTPPAGPRRSSVGTPAELRRPDADADADADAEKKPPPPAPPKLVVVGKPQRGVRVEDLTALARARWEKLQAIRAWADLARETSPPGAFQSWSDEVDAEGLDEGQLEHAHVMHLRDKDFRDRCWPTAVFITPGVFRARVPEKLEATQ